MTNTVRFTVDTDRIAIHDAQTGNYYPVISLKTAAYFAWQANGYSNSVTGEKLYDLLRFIEAESITEAELDDLIANQEAESGPLKSDDFLFDLGRDAGLIEPEFLATLTDSADAATQNPPVAS